MPSSGRPSQSPPANSPPRGGCRVQELLSFLGQPHMLELLAALRTAGPRSLRFTELQTTVGVCPRTLSLRLRTLVEAGFLTRHAYRETPPRVEYQPTARLEQLNEVFALLESWSRTNSLHVTPIVSTLGKVESAVTSRNG